jgi:hypothetical protein
MGTYIILLASAVTNDEGSRHYTWLQIGMRRGENAAANAEIKLDFTMAKRREQTLHMVVNRNAKERRRSGEC